MAGELIALVSCPPDKAHEVATKLVDARLAACVNVVKGVSSVYRWEGKVTTDDESLLVIKTNQTVWDSFQQMVQAVHPYDVPEIICVSIEKGNKAYLDWLNDSVALETVLDKSSSDK